MNQLPLLRVRSGFVCALALALSLLLTVPAALQAQYTCATNDDGTLTLTQYSGSDAVVILPDSIDGRPVASIGYGAFANNASLLSVTIPENIGTIGGNAFFYCGNLTNVTLPNTVTNIGAYAFIGCSSLPGITFPESLRSIDTSAFAWCGGLTNILIPKGATNLSYAMFDNCANLTAFTVDALNPSYCSVDGVLFDKHQTLLVEYPSAKAGGYTVPSSVTQIDGQAFEGCQRLTSITLPKSITLIPWAAFGNCTGLTNVTLSRVTDIGYSAFSGCSGLQRLTLPVGLKRIYPYAFAGCNGLTQVTIPGSVSYIGEGALGMGSLRTIQVDSLNLNYRSVDGVLFDKPVTTLLSCPGARVGSYALPHTVTRIEDYAFNWCAGLTNISIPDRVTAIGERAFYACSGLTSLTLPSHLTSLGVGAFEWCSSLTRISIPKGVTSIPGSAFSECQALTNVFLPDTLTNIDSFAFDDCYNLTEVTLPGALTSLGDYAFEWCSSLSALYFSGDAPALGGQSVLRGDGNATVYYLQGTHGWDATFTDRPTVPVNRYQPVSATYTGLFFRDDGVWSPGAGWCTLKTTATGKFTGTLFSGGVRYPLSGGFNSFGHAQLFLSHPPARDLMLDLCSAGSDELTGTVSGGAGDASWAAALSAPRAAWDDKSSPAPQPRAYTLDIAGDSTDPTVPGGDSCGSLTVDPTGRVRFAGVLADGTKVTQAVPLSQAGTWPLYLGLYQGQGVLTGWLTLTNDQLYSPNGQLDWFKPSAPGSHCYPDGFLLDTVGLVSPYTRPSAGDKVLNLAGASVVLSGAGLTQELTSYITLGASSRVTSTDQTRLTFNLSTGTFTGRMPNPEDPAGKPLTFHGVVLQSLNNGWGWFLNANQSGAVYFGE